MNRLKIGIILCRKLAALPQANCNLHALQSAANFCERSAKSVRSIIEENAEQRNKALYGLYWKSIRNGVYRASRSAGTHQRWFRAGVNPILASGRQRRRASSHT